MNQVLSLDRVIRGSLESFYRDLCSMESCGREREAVSRYAFAYLVKCCHPGTVLHDSAQIGIEVAVRQLGRRPAYPHVGQTVCKDLVIWRDPNMLLWKADSPHFEPLAIMEWKMIHVFDRLADRRKKLKDYELDIQWLEYKARAVGTEFMGYAVFIDSTCDPKKLICTKVSADRTLREWFKPSALQRSGNI